mgnify:CR=1 FL=1|jgi:uncharacterized membrane protein YczE|tara:strand:+ start:347 stop:988 length:642 start_codon:yes stop_codon:yes gene_type:complete
MRLTFLRAIRLFSGLIIFGIGLAMMLESQLGVGAWEVLHEGIASHVDLEIQFYSFSINLGGVGVISIFGGATVLLFWIPLGERPGIGTILNMSVTGVALDISMALIPSINHLGVQIIMVLIAPSIVAAGTVLYIGAGLGPGPRDGLMTGLARKGIPIPVGRTLIELSVLTVGYLLGGTLGFGTIWFAFTIGPLIRLYARKIDPGLDSGLRRRH